MKITLSFAMFLLGSVQAAQIKCPNGERLVSGITTAKPKSVADLRSLSVTPPIYGTPNEWDLDSVSNHGARKLYLSCILKDGTRFSKQIPSTDSKCSQR